MAYRIGTDTCCDFPQHMYKEWDLSVVPLSVRFEGQDLLAGAFVQQIEVSLHIRNQMEQTAAHRHRNRRRRRHRRRRRSSGSCSPPGAYSPHRP